MPLSTIERQNRFKARRAQEGLFPVTVYSPKLDRRLLHAFAKHLLHGEIGAVVIQSRKTGQVRSIAIDDY